jgi:transposase
MRLKTILNQTLKCKSFVFKKCQFGAPVGECPTIEVEVVPRKGSQAICSGCNQARPGYDSLSPRRFEHIPMWGFLVFFVYALRRVDCPKCGVKVEIIPWAKGKNQLTESYSWFLANWAKRLSWKEVGECFRTTWHHVFTAVKMAVEWGREQMDLSNISAIGVDEVLWHRGHKYLTVVYQIDHHCKRLLWIGKDRNAETFQKFFEWFEVDRIKKLKFVCSDMWKAYMNIIAEKAGNALHILDRFHIMAQINKAINKVRNLEVKKLKEDGQLPILKNCKWIFLKRPENLTESQDQKLAGLLKQNLKTVKSYLLKEDFQRLWGYISPYWAGKFIDRWTRKVMYSRIVPMKDIAKMIRRHKPLILNWFKAKRVVSSGAVEGLNNKLKLTFRKAYGFRTYKATEIQLYHTLGNLLLPKFTHKFF